MSTQIVAQPPPSTTLRTDPDAVRTFFEHITLPGEVREIRIPKSKRGPARLFGTVSGYVDNATAPAEALGQLAGADADAVYTTLNPVDPEAMARAFNRIQSKAETTSSDADVAARRLLLIDCDPARLSGIASTDAEMQAALSRRDEIRAYLSDQHDWPDPLVVTMSGNGGGLLYRIDEPNDTETTALIAGVLQGLATLFDDDTVGVDTSVANAARLTKIPGTVSAKGDHTNRRPWRLATAEYPILAGTVSRAMLSEVAALAPATNGTHPPGRRKGTIDDLLALNNLRATIKVQPYGTAYELDRCLTSNDHTDGAVLLEMHSGALAYSCRHNRCQGMGWSYLKETGRIELPTPALPAITNIPYPQNGNGENEPKELSAEVPAADRHALSVEDFRAYMPTHKYIFTPTGEMWPASSVNARIKRIGIERASEWLDRHQPVEQLTWFPGAPRLIEGRIVDNGGWVDHPGATCFNLYRPPTLTAASPVAAKPWLDHVHWVYGDVAHHIIHWLAHRVQRPGEKINHALVLGGAQGIGKDTILEPVKHAIGPWNFQDISPVQLIGRFNGFVESVILRVSEARDLGDIDRYGFYEHTKTLTAAPPDVLRVDKKNTNEYAVPNVCGVVITTNHKTDGIYLPADDRRHYVAWSDRIASDAPADYWNRAYRWYADGGLADVAAYLATLDLSDFDPKAPPPKTAAFWEIVDAGRAPEDNELADALEGLNYPDATTLESIAAIAGGTDPDFATWLRERKNRRQIPHRMETAGYVPVRNPDRSDGRWNFHGHKHVIYARRDIGGERERITAARRLAGR